MKPSAETVAVGFASLHPPYNWCQNELGAAACFPQPCVVGTAHPTWLQTRAITVGLPLREVPASGGPGVLVVDSPQERGVPATAAISSWLLMSGGSKGVEKETAEAYAPASPQECAEGRSPFAEGLGVSPNSLILPPRVGDQRGLKTMLDTASTDHL